MTLINWTPETQRAFTKENLLFTHSIADSELFSEEALIALIDRYPRDSVEVFTMGYDPAVFGEWYLGRKTALRRLFSLNPSLARSPKLLEPFKIVFARAYKLLSGGFKGHKSPLTPAFSLDPQQPGTIIYDDGITPFASPVTSRKREKVA
ncbi:hypothetical protein [Asticcacaulis sp.]|uniref:hypothetical protein n=1 Tax=Asticcacaulis sp. TaxID=1872648 RepID=UPI003F7B4FC3